MIVYFGLNKTIGNVSYYDSTGASEYSLTKPYSEATAETIDKELSEFVEKAYQRAKTILLENKAKLEILAGRLLEKEVIFREDLEEVFGMRPYDDYEEEVNGKKEIKTDKPVEDTKTDRPADVIKSEGDTGVVGKIPREDIPK